MILFVFEGRKSEPQIFKALEYLYFNTRQTLVCSYGNNIYDLYRELSSLDGAGDIVSLLRERDKDNTDSPFSTETKSSDFSEIFLFFDYDFQNRNLTLEQMNKRISEMLGMFSDETDTGKLYINYPMVEAIRYTKKLPDEDFVEYTITRKECQDKGFKGLAQEFSHYKSLDYIVPDLRKQISGESREKIRSNWQILQEMNVSKANYLCCGEKLVPTDKNGISQQNIFNTQLEKHIIPYDSVAILSAFPLFNFEYFK